MAHNPLVSIIMPTYNAKRNYMTAAIDSCVQQHYSNWELIIVDDASTNDAPQIITKYCSQNERIRAIRHSENRKLPAALNTGIECSCGEYLTWLSDDDLFRAKALERMVSFLENHRQYDLVFTDYSLIDERGKVIEPVAVGKAEELGISKPVGICHLGRRIVFEALEGFNEDFFLAEDLDFWVRAFMRFNLVPLHEDLALYRQHGGTLTNTFTKRRILRVHGKILDTHMANMHWLDRRAGAHAYLRLAKNLLGNGDVSAGLRYLAKSIRLSPANLLLASKRVLWKGIRQRRR